MCGIAGLVNVDGRPASLELLERMADAMTHRGPDGGGAFADGPVGLSHRRLAIQDLTSAADQPMQSLDRRWTLSYNGEVYNAPSLRTELEAKGHRFRSHGDTEVVLNGLCEWGPRAVERFNGIFALAAWDAAAHTLLLARDRYGVKPLYYASTDKMTIFASEVKGIMVHPSFRVDLDPEALVEYLTFQNIFSDRTLFEGVRMLPPGCTMTLSPHGPRAAAAAPVRYWDFSFLEPDDPIGEAEYIDSLHHLFERAVSSQLVSDVPVSSYLSGGIDSGSITALAAQGVANLHTFTVGFDLSSISGLELASDERQAAEHMSYLFGTEHYEMVLKAGDMERAMTPLVWHLEDLRVGQSYPNFYAARLAGKFGKVVLSGVGGDELFGGYPWRYFRSSEPMTFPTYLEHSYAYWHRLMSESELRRLLAPVWGEVSHVATRDVFADVFTSHMDRLDRPADFINHALYLEAKTFLPGLLLVEDKLSMAYGLESRVPFLDNDLVSFAQQVPARFKLTNLSSAQSFDENEPGPKAERYYQQTREGKQLLRKVLSKYVPDEAAQRQKRGFSGPDASWFRGESIDYVRRTLLEGTPLIYDFLDRDAVRSLVTDHLDGRSNRRLLIWSLISLEQWCHLFLDGTTRLNMLGHGPGSAAAVN